MTWLRSMFEHFRAYHSHGRAYIEYTGMVGVAAFPLFYLLRFTKSSPPYDDLWLRVLAMLICAGLATRQYWPERLKPYYIAYSYGALLYCLPFFFTFTALVNGGGVVAVANTMMATFLLILLTDWRNTIVTFVIGTVGAALLYAALVPNPVIPMDYAARLPILVLVIIGGSIFKFVEKQAEAEKIKRTYRALAGSIAHEMRNPLSQIRNNLDRIQQALPLPTTSLEPQPLSPVQADALYRLLAESELAVNRGLQVIAMTLDEVSAKPIDSRDFRLLSAAEATRKAVDEYGWDSMDERSKVEVHVIEDFTFRGDETAYLFVLFNLIKNAFHYMTLKPDATLSFVVEGRQVRVRDSGPGIAPELQAELFEPFNSAGKSGGTGLGLAYCRRVMRSFGGEIDCESVVGEYTVFTLRFPPVNEEATLAQRQATRDAAHAALHGKHLLIVDDDAMQRMITRHKLQPLQMAVDEAESGRRALELLATRHYDLVLLDLNMPVLDGYGVAQRIRAAQDPRHRNVRIVAHTSEPAHLAAVKARKAGMDGFVGKPCAQLPLMQALQSAMATPARLGHDAAPLAGRRILLADDSTANRKAVAAYLRHAGAEVGEAGHGQAVLDLLRSGGEWQAIVMDLNMPGMGGLDAARAIRTSGAAWRDIPIVAVTAYSDAETAAAAREVGMDEILTKPVEAGVLFAKLGQLTGDRQQAPSSQAAQVQRSEELLDVDRLASYCRIGMLEELLNEFLPEIGRLVDRLDHSHAQRDFQSSLDTLHSLLGMSGEAGATALYHMVRRVYVPMVEQRSWPSATDWVEHIRALAGRTEAALRAYGVQQTAVKAG
jgi:two-component system CAI-1 autoinducer sensor kinase/phosphatase CqsS